MPHTLRTIALPFATAALLLSGCVVDRSYDESLANSDGVERFSDQGYGVFGDVALRDGRLVGDIGPVRNLDNDATLSGWDDGNYTTLEVVAQNQDGAAMNLIDIYGGIDHPLLRPGTTHTFSGVDIAEEGALQLYVLGCAGDAPYQWTYDTPADEVEVTVSETEDGLRRFDFTTRTASGDFGGTLVSTGTFVVENP